MCSQNDISIGTDAFTATAGAHTHRRGAESDADMALQDLTMMDRIAGREIAGHEIARHENAGREIARHLLQTA